jgi:uncharacterized protein (DUF58 family)
VSPTSDNAAPSPWPAPLAAARQEAESASHVLRLPFRGHLWRGRAGTWLGSGSGTSLEFQDHRVYVPGDDPRHINWQAYARTGVYSMKLYREEVSPSVDVVLDTTASMILTETKARRALALLLFAMDCGQDAGASVRAWTLGGGDPEMIPPGALDSGGATLTASVAATAPDLTRIPFRSGSLRVLVTDALFEAAPDPLLARFVAGGGRGVVLLPFAAEEAEPDWSGPIELQDCETGTRRDQQMDSRARERYVLAYRRHFAAWQDAGRRHGVAVARVPSEPPLVEALRYEALAAGAVEPA